MKLIFAKNQEEFKVSSIKYRINEMTNAPVDIIIVASKETLDAVSMKYSWGREVRVSNNTRVYEEIADFYTEKDG